MESADRPRVGTSRRLLALFWAVMLLVSGPGVAVAVPSASAAETPVQSQTQPTAVAQNETNNTTVQHRDPETVDEQGNIEDVRRWLSSRMAESLSQSTLQLSQGQYQQAQEVLGDQYSDYFGKYVDVAGETEDVDTTTARTLNQTRTTQHDYVQAVKEFRETANAYREAKQAGNESRTRRLARRLASQGDRVATLSDRLQEQYTVVGNQTGVEMADTSHRIENITSDITAQQTDIVTAELVRTTLSITANSPSASFGDGVILSGQLRATGSTQNFTPSQDRIRLTVGNQVIQTRVQDDGSFSVQYRPVTVQRGVQEVAVEYRPHANSLYLGSTANTSIRIQQVEPTLTVATNANVTRFGDVVTVQGRVSAAGQGVPHIPVVVTVGGTRLGRVATMENGTYQYTTTVPAAVPTGAQSVTVRMPLQNRAIASIQESTPIRVTSTATNLSLTGEWQSGQLVLSGALQTADGKPIAGEVVRLSLNGLTVATVTTNASGGYRATAEPTQTTGQVHVVARYGGHGSLETARSATNVTVPSGGTGPGTGGGAGSQLLPNLGLGLPVIGGIGVLIVLSLVAGGYLLWRRGRDTPSTTAEQASEEQSPISPSTEEAAAGEPATSTDESLLEIATEALADGRAEQAVQLAYAAIRQSMAATTLESDQSRTEGTSSDAPQTHWEFYNAHAETDVAEALRTLTVAYEQAAFAPSGIGQKQAQDAIAAAQTILEQYTQK